MTKRPKPIVLTVLDGWGYRAETQGNAIALARKPAYDRLIKDFPNTLIQTSGPAVGLPEGQMGNGEAAKSGNCFRALLHGRTRHPAAQRTRFCAATSTEDARAWSGKDRDAGGTILRHGSRQSLGAHRTRLPRDGAWRIRNAYFRSRRCSERELRSRRHR